MVGVLRGDGRCGVDGNLVGYLAFALRVSGQSVLSGDGRGRVDGNLVGYLEFVLRVSGRWAVGLEWGWQVWG